MTLCDKIIHNSTYYDIIILIKYIKISEVGECF